MKYFGREGYCRLAESLMENTRFLYDGLKEIGYDVVCKPELNIVAFNHPNVDTNLIAEKLEEKNWKVSVAKCPKAIRVVLMNHIKKSHLKKLLEDLKDIY
jgi:tyrosine decarboxylase/aspartate 1-decarboxylase